MQSLFPDTLRGLGHAKYVEDCRLADKRQKLLDLEANFVDKQPKFLDTVPKLLDWPIWMPLQVYETTRFSTRKCPFLNSLRINTNNEGKIMW
ncbi:hypothetical protein AWM68_18060 [Fictibacillus phosphorivorans]|uniref:Uncharacterized protein n=1 Tax=Fictibacillus phosphorivorans TaxID=1221500 RepID=A0A163RW12_9BACL|nr:hypothetical protein AWM68_18060 [Fictibacillus phosphorivorans]